MHSHSKFFSILTQRGHTLTFVDADSREFTLKTFGEFNFDNIIMFAPRARDFASLSFDDVNEFVENGGNLLFAANSELSEPMRAFAESCGVEFDKKGTEVIDHFSFDGEVDDRYRHFIKYQAYYWAS